MEDKFEHLDLENDVISGIPEEIFDNRHTFTVEDFVKSLKKYCNLQKQYDGLFAKGIDCKILKPGKQWQKGKIRITLEFCPEEPNQPPSPLDDLRKQIKET
jgi:hypothetical protein